MCWGCNPTLLAQGISCDQQATELDLLNNTTLEHWRDCSCNSNSIMYDNCCEDFQETCPHFYEGFRILHLNINCNDHIRRSGLRVL